MQSIRFLIVPGCCLLWLLFVMCVCLMLEYRVYFIDLSGGIADAQWLLASTDEQAMSQAELIQSNLVREVWQKDREVGTLRPAAHN